MNKYLIEYLKEKIFSGRKQLWNKINDKVYLLVRSNS